MSPKLRSTASGVAHWCPACREPHVYATHASATVRWQFDGDVVAPSFSPSMLRRKRLGAAESVCHYSITRGRVHFYGDCTHPLRGQTVDLPDWPTEGEWADFEES